MNSHVNCIYKYQVITYLVVILMRIVIENTNIILPDKNEVLKNSSLVVDNGVITRILSGSKHINDYTAHTIIDAEEGYLIPGLINNHIHGVTLAPLFPSAAPPLPLKRVLDYLDRNLLQGATTLLNVDGFGTIEEVGIVNKLHPIKIKTATSHTPLNVEAAKKADGRGLTPIHEALTAKEMVLRGAIAIGEIGGGHTLGGGGADYLALPRAVERKTGVLLAPPKARKLKEAVLGRHIDPSRADKSKVEEVLTEIGLEGKLNVEEAIEVVTDAVYPSVEIARKGFKEAALIASEMNVPMIVHNAAASMEVILEIGRFLKSKLIAGHSNHNSFEEDEMLLHARKLRELGVVIDICSTDALGAKQLYDSLDATLKMIGEGLVDVISTDFMAGYWDPILAVLEKAVDEGVISLPKAIAMGTYNVVKAIPNLHDNGGLIDVGRTADLVVVDADKISKVKYVLINGMIVVREGRIVHPLTRGLLS